MLLIALLVTPAADPQPHYYFTLYGGQSVPFRPRTAHTWATFTKTIGPIQESFTISWLPADGQVRPLRLRLEPGRNFTLAETFELLRTTSLGVSVSSWGPYEIGGERYEAALRQWHLLESGVVSYRAVDSFTGNRSVQNCVHAVTYADPVLQHLRQPVLRVGEPGTSKLITRYRDSGAFLTQVEVGAPVRRRWLR